ncbi:MAG TPA: hypothetical protein DHW45_17850 [Candidatus Latescibacteria bacterium]|nr:hypothetical protein [Candidatus Latescibacterota bacterium]
MFDAARNSIASSVRIVLEDNRMVTETANDHGVTHNLLCKWVQKLRGYPD